MVDYNNLALTAQRLINENGRDVTIIKNSETPSNPTEPWRDVDSNDTSVGPIKAVIFPFNENDIDGTLVRRGDRRCLLSALSTGSNLVEQFDQLLDGTDEWKIEGVEVISPGPIRVIYDLQLRR